MQIQLTQKERMLLEDGKKQENLCAKKYQSYANQVQGPQLKNLLMEIVQEEQHHYNMINQILQGVQPDMTQKPINITTEAHTTFQGPGQRIKFY